MLGGSKAAVLNAAAKRRLLSDLKRLQEEPLPLAAARPCSDADLTLWDGVVGVEMHVTHLERVPVPLHFLIDFPADYPQSAPNIGFSFEFRYSGGFQGVMKNGRLKGKKVICLDMLGNFANAHTEWKGEVGSGWSPAYTVTTLLVQLQSVLSDCGQQMSQRERDATYQSAEDFFFAHPSAALELLDEDEVRNRQQQRRREGLLSRACGGDAALLERALDFARRSGLGHDEQRMEAFVALLVDVAGAGGGRAARGGSGSGSGSGSAATPPAPAVDENICCFATGKLYTEALLGVGVARERANLSTAGELLSKEAFDSGHRKSTNKAAFEFFLPVWINEAHSANRPEWREALVRGCLLIGTQVYGTSARSASGLDDAALEVFPRLINQMIVEMMKPEMPKSEAITTFEAMCNFWRTFRYLVDKRHPIRGVIRELLSRFATDEAFRHKDNTPDLGVVLVLYTVFQGHEGCPSRAAFINAFADESPLRWVMWWQRAGTRPESGPVFEATKVSREICMFQMMLVDTVLGDVSEALAAMEATNCKLPDRLPELQSRWRQCKASTDSWAAYFQHIGADRPVFASTEAWIADCAARAAAKGPKYGGEGNGKGRPPGVTKFGWSEARAAARAAGGDASPCA